jgi:hypothetical protein
MVETAAHLSGHVFPRLPVRQWVLSVPKRLRYFMQRDGAVLNMVLRIFLRVISQSLQTHSSGAAQVDKAALHIGAVAFIHRFGSSLNGHVHFHVCVVDGVFEDRSDDHWTTRKRVLVAAGLRCSRVHRLRKMASSVKRLLPSSWDRRMPKLDQHRQ